MFVRFCALFVAGFLLLSGSASATNFSFTGTFGTDDEHQIFSFTVASTSTITLRTWSYAGGTNAAGTLIARGGFDPILALFDSTGAKIGENDDGGCGLVAGDAVTTACWDTFFTATVNAGTYFASVQEYDNFNLGTLADGFSRDGQGNFTGGFNCPDDQPSFQDVTGLPGCGRTNAWAFDILGVDTATVENPTGVPEPASLALLGAGLIGLGFKRSRRKRQ